MTRVGKSKDLEMKENYHMPGSNDRIFMQICGPIFPFRQALTRYSCCVQCVKSDLVCSEGRWDRSDFKSGTFNMLDCLGPISFCVGCSAKTNEHSLFECDV
ncbi:hypothetical protein ILYODFUR_010734 [Ilyodon furcidens]|uniref:Uncharacterized protein n=1 Tax=Ilyodon furcidens TaxID=33524 RepID=A0ABV0U4A9_9TELE